jgi:curved DNA-binding protein CbpA
MVTESIPTFDCYAELGVPTSAERHEIEAAYRTLAMRFHPDRATDVAAATARMIRLNAAHTWLIDPDRRTRYDRERHPLRATRTVMPSPDRYDGFRATSEPNRLRDTILMVALMGILGALLLGFGTVVFVIAAIACILMLVYFGVMLAMESRATRRRD